jgi:glutamine synthetase
LTETHPPPNCAQKPRSSIRIPLPTVKQGKGYLEDRRPAAKMDPYEICAILLETVCS